MYKCLECGLKFEEPKIYTEDCSPASSLESGFIQGFKGCPACEGDYIEICECDNCQEWFEKSMLFNFSIGGAEPVVISCRCNAGIRLHHYS